MAKKKNPVLAALLGNWLGHPLHPAIVHVPIALWLGALIFDALNYCNIGGNALVRTSYWAIALGLLSTVLVIPAGIAEWTQIKREKPAWKLAFWHMILNVVTVLLLIVSMLFRSGDAYFATRVPWNAFMFIIAADAVLLVSGYLGGRMVYEHGIGVARQSRKKWRQIAAAGGANLPAEK